MRISDWSSDVCSSDLGQQLIGDRDRSCADLLSGLGAVWAMMAIGVIQQILARQQPTDFTEDRKTTNSGIENADRRAAIFLAHERMATSSGIGVGSDSSRVTSSGTRVRIAAPDMPRSEQRRVGKECVRSGR